MTYSPKRICVLRLSALGDVILTVPLIRTLQKAFPQSEIMWITSKAVYPLLEGLDGVNFCVIDKPNSILDYWRFKKRMQHEEFDVLFALQASFRCNLLYPLIKAKIKIGYDRVRARDGQRFFINQHIAACEEHLLDSFLSFASHMGVHEHDIRWDLKIASEDDGWAKKIVGEGPILAVNAAASKKERDWPLERYVKVLQQAQQRWGLTVVFTGGPSQHEKELAQKIEKRLTHGKVINLVGKTNLKQLAAVLKHADLLLSPDTGPAHLATAVGTPVVGIYAVAPATLSGPYFSQHLVVDKFNDAVKTILKKDPRKIPWGTRVHDQGAMSLISVDDVIGKLAIAFQPTAK